MLLVFILSNMPAVWKGQGQRDFLWHNKILRQIYHGSDREPKVIYHDILWTTESVPQYIDLRVNNSSHSKPKLKRHLAINTKPHHQTLLRYWLNQNWRKHKIKRKFSRSMRIKSKFGQNGNMRWKRALLWKSTTK